MLPASDEDARRLFDLFALAGGILGCPQRVRVYEQELEARVPWQAHYVALDGLVVERERTAQAAYVVGWPWGYPPRRQEVSGECANPSDSEAS